MIKTEATIQLYHIQIQKLLHAMEVTYLHEQKSRFLETKIKGFSKSIFMEATD